MPTDRIMQRWQSFRAQCIPLDATPGQVKQMRRAFFGGVAAAFGMLAAVSRDDASEADGVIMLEEAHEECRAFVQRVRAGEL